LLAGGWAVIGAKRAIDTSLSSRALGRLAA
jgi:hypothetical protein